MSKGSSRALLTPQEVQWAYQKRCEGVPLTRIAKALYCSGVTIERSFKRAGLVVEDKLVYEGDRDG